MYEWLEREITQIKTRKFHLVDGPASPLMRERVRNSTLPVSASYKEFVLRFGNARLYREARNGYSIGVFAGPNELVRSDGSVLFQIGFFDGASACIRPAHKPPGFPIVELEAESEAEVAGDFEEWLTLRSDQAREAYGREKWEEILRGPDPFTQEELELVEARSRILWRVVGIDSDGNQIFEVTNAGNRTLPAFTVGVHTRDRRLNGAVRLKIGHIQPGQSALVHAGCYKQLVRPSEIEVFQLPDPEPEDRGFYWEFRSIDK